MEHFILSTTTILGILIAFKFNGAFQKVISVMLMLSVLLVWSGDRNIITLCFITFAIIAVMTVVYGFVVKGLDNLERISLVAMGLAVAISSVVKMNHYQGAAQFRFLMIIPVILTLLSFIKSRKLTREMSFMITWLVYALSELSRLFI